MKKTFNLDHDAENMNDVIARCDVDDQPMLEAIFTTVGAVSAKRTTESRAFYLGMVSVMAMAAEDSDGIRRLEKPSGMLESILKVAHNEASIGSFLAAMQVTCLGRDRDELKESMQDATAGGK